jgi:hydrogenase maturation protease
MNLATVEKIAKAVLYEGYMLYPYRPSSVKNQQRWNFGVLCPRSYSEAQNGTEAWTMQTECLVEGSTLTAIEVRVRFLQLTERTVTELVTPVNELPRGEMPQYRLVEKFEVNSRTYQPWQEAIEREVMLPVCNVEALGHNPVIQSFSFPAEKEYELLRESDGRITGVLIRARHDLRGEVEVTVARQNGDGICKVSVCIRNTAPFKVVEETGREEALLRALISAHTVLGVQDGGFISLLAPPEEIVDLAACCKNIGTWPVLVGEEGQADTMLSSPIILYDYPQIAPESAGDLFDGTEIDEILSLRIMTLTDDEKREMSQSDERARLMLERTEAMPAEQFMKLHGVLRGLHPVDLHTDLRRVDLRPSQEETR